MTASAHGVAYMRTPKHKMTWGEAWGGFIYDYDEQRSQFAEKAAKVMAGVRKLGIAASGVTVGTTFFGIPFDDWVYIIFGGYAVVRVWRIRRKANRPQVVYM